MKPIDKLFLPTIISEPPMTIYDELIIDKLNQLTSSHNKLIKIIEEQQKFFTIYEIHDKVNFIKLKENKLTKE